MSSRNAPPHYHLWGGALRDDTKNGCVADYSEGKLQTTRNGNVPPGIVQAFAISWSVKQRCCRNPFSNSNEIDQYEKQNVCDNLEKMQQVVIANLLLEEIEPG